MDQCSCQVEMSAAGLMSHAIEQCLAVVIKALRKCDLPVATSTAGGSKMLKKDRIGFISTNDLQSPRAQSSN